MTIDGSGLVPMLEAIYALDLDDQAWLQQVLCSLAALCGPEYHYVGYFYDASNPEDFKCWNVSELQAPFGLDMGFRLFKGALCSDFVRATFLSLQTGSARQTSQTYMNELFAYRSRIGWGDIFNINGLDPSGFGCLLTIGCRETEFVADARERALYRRIASHLGAGYRCRRRLGAAQSGATTDSFPGSPLLGAEAIVDEHGKVVHAIGAAAGATARSRIREAVVARTNSRLRRCQDPLDGWHPLTGARWTLVDYFEEDGRRYLVARENQAQAHALDSFTDRERQVVVHAVLGMTNKEVAYALGISAATVRVLIARAAGKLGARSRKELLEHPALLALRNRSGATSCPGAKDV